jgi:phosphoglucosamine mutase
MGKLFGTDGIRGTTNHSQEDERILKLTPELALRVGHAVGRLVRNQLTDRAKSQVILGRDPRISGMMIESAIKAGLLAQGVDVAQVGIIPTPAVAFLTRRLDAQIGIIISASHNPVEDNGIKLFGPEGYKLSDELEEHIQTQVLDSDLTFVPCDTRNLGKLQPREDLQPMYIEYLVQSWRGEKDLSGLFVFLDCANGATSYAAPEILQRLGAKVEIVNGTPDGLNINASYEYINPVQFGKLVVQTRADFGVAFDGDGDRAILVDERGNVVDGDAIMAILARSMLARNRLPEHIVVTTNMSNYGLEDSLNKIGVKIIETQVGDKFVLKKMLAAGSTLGGERSGHILILDGDQTTGDGIYTALAVASTIADQDASLSELASVMQRYPQFIESADVPPKKPPLKDNVQIQDVIKQLQTQLGMHVDINVRYSGTENKLRLSVRGRSDDDLDLMRKESQEALSQIARIITVQVAQQSSPLQIPEENECVAEIGQSPS